MQTEAAVAGLKVEAAHCVGKGQPKELACEDLHACVAGAKGTLWVNLVAYERAEAERFLQSEFGFHPLEVEDALSSAERPSVSQQEHYLFLVAPAVFPSNRHERYIEIAFFLGRQYLVTVTTEPCPYIEERFQRWKARPVPSKESPAALLHWLLDGIVDAYFPVVDALEDQIENLEQVVFHPQKGMDIRDGLRAKRRLLEFRRRITPLRDVTNSLLRRDIPFIQADLRPYFHDIYDHTLRLVESLDINRDILATMLEAHLSIVSNKLNEVMRWLAVVSTILMSVGFMAGVFGMNFKYMPELSWPLGYPLALISMLGVAAVEYWIFKRKGWL